MKPWETILGVLGGGRGAVDAAALSAKAGLLTADAKSKVLDRLRLYGEKYGKVGPDYFKAILEGAQPAAAADRKAREIELVGTSREDLSQYLLWGLGALVLFLFLRRA